ncbi:hypothetical protein O181_001883 [Austropuccinia psidii MF-1]|uniref:Uncharacterized protein n=1 Tax=Austropuccinia psidii MF-1 TaxID=1389203 RepID=A0A9Q3BBD7_9BASI|nr:hypothetical protein [Austropuccinia psidii MF-1]
MGPLGPLWPKSNEAKRGQRGNPPAPKAIWVPTHKCANLSQFWPQISTIPKWPESTPGPKLAKNHKLVTFNPWTLESTRGHQLSSNKASPQFRGRPLLHQCTPYQRIQAWCIYGIIYHHAPFLLRNPMVILSVPNYVFLINVPKFITHFKGRFSLIQSCNHWQLPEDHLRTPTTWACRSRVIISFQDYSKGNFKRLSIIESVVKASSTSVFLGKANWSIQSVFKQPVWP